MIITDRLVFLQLQKTGCSHIQRLLCEHFGAVQQGLHNRIEEMGEVGERRIAGSIRNPWDWYASLWAFGCRKLGAFRNNLVLGRPARALPAVGGDGATVSEIASACYDAAGIEDFRRWLRMVLDPAHAPAVREGYEHFTRREEMGIYSYRYLWLFVRDEKVLADGTLPGIGELVPGLDDWLLPVRMLRNERLVEDFLDLMEEVDGEVPEATRQAVLGTAPTNVSRASHDYREFYDADTRRLVEERESLVIQRFGYVFE